MEKVLNKNICNKIRGLLFIYIVIRHISNYVYGIPFFLRQGFLAVSFFLFLSGWGLNLQLKEKGKNYLDNFVKKKILRLFLPIIILLPIFLILKLKILNYTLDFSLIGIIRRVHSSNFIIDFSWYVYIQAVIYIIFYIMQKYTKNGNVNLLICNFLLLIFFILLKFSACYYLSILCFNLGYILFEKKEQVYAFMKKKNTYILFISLALFLCCMFIYSHTQVMLILAVFGVISSLLFCIILVCILYVVRKINFSSKLLDFLGNISYEAYLVQGISMILIFNIFHFDNIFLSIICVLFLTIFLGLLLNLIDKKITNMLQRR